VATVIDEPERGGGFEEPAALEFHAVAGVLGVSAKSHEFDDAGDEVRTDYRRMLALVVKGGYRGHVGIEYEGKTLPEMEGVRATKRLLEKVRDELSS
ncbi:MAG: hypothetical protein ACKOCN_12395, partial [Planctomycetaceae bacterium]